MTDAQGHGDALDGRTMEGRLEAWIDPISFFRRVGLPHKAEPNRVPGLH